MFEEIYNSIKNNSNFIYENGIYIQKQDSISMFEINEKEKLAMDNLVREESLKNSNKLEEYYSNYSTLKIIEKNIEIIKQQESGNIAIDCGCGKGEYLEELSKKFQLVIAIDISLDAIIYAKSNNANLNNVLYINGSMLDLYNVFNRTIADFCLSAEVIEHVPSPTEYLCNINNLLKENGNLLVSTPCQNLYFYPAQFLSMLLTKPITLYKLLNPLKHWLFALDWHPAMSKKVFLNLLEKHFSIKKYDNFVPYYFDKFPIFYYIAKFLPKDYSLNFYKKYLKFYNSFIERIGFGIRQHCLVKKQDLSNK